MTLKSHRLLLVKPWFCELTFHAAVYSQCDGKHPVVCQLNMPTTSFARASMFKLLRSLGVKEIGHAPCSCMTMSLQTSGYFCISWPALSHRWKSEAFLEGLQRILVSGLGSRQSYDVSPLTLTIPILCGGEIRRVSATRSFRRSNMCSLDSLYAASTGCPTIPVCLLHH